MLWDGKDGTIFKSTYLRGVLFWGVWFSLVSNLAVLTYFAGKAIQTYSL